MKTPITACRSLVFIAFLCKIPDFKVIRKNFFLILVEQIFPFSFNTKGMIFITYQNVLVFKVPNKNYFTELCSEYIVERS